VDALGELRTSLATLVRALFPSLGGPRGPIRARVTAVHEGGGASSELEPRYSVDVQPLAPDGSPDPDLPELPDVPLGVLWAGPGRGLFALPTVGAIVRVGFEYGDLGRPYIESCTAEGYDVPGHPQGRLVLMGGGARIAIEADGTIRVGGGGTVHVDGGRVVLAGGGAGVVTTAYVCPYTSSPHGGGSSSVEAAP